MKETKKLIKLVIAREVLCTVTTFVKLIFCFVIDDLNY